MEKLLNTQVSVITGGSRGIGAKIAEVFAKNGSKIIIIYGADTKSALKVKDKILKYGSSCEVIKLDLNKKNNYKKLIKSIEKNMGKLITL